MASLVICFVYGSDIRSINVFSGHSLSYIRRRDFDDHEGMGRTIEQNAYPSGVVFLTGLLGYRLEPILRSTKQMQRRPDELTSHSTWFLGMQARSLATHSFSKAASPEIDPVGHAAKREIAGATTQRLGKSVGRNWSIRPLARYDDRATATMNTNL